MIFGYVVVDDEVFAVFVLEYPRRRFRICVLFFHPLPNAIGIFRDVQRPESVSDPKQYARLPFPLVQVVGILLPLAKECQLLLIGHFLQLFGEVHRL